MIFEDFCLKSSRLHLRPLIPTDAPALQHLTNHPDILSRISFMPTVFDAQEAENLIASQDDNNLFLAITLEENGQLAGAFGLHMHQPEKIEIGYWLGKQHQGQGLARECLAAVTQWATINKPSWILQAECHPDNAASMGLLLSSGFVDNGLSGQRPGRKLLQFSASQNQ